MMNLKAVVLCLGLLISVASGHAQNGEDSESYTLERCIEYALKNNSNVKNANFETYLAKAQIGETRSVGLPQLTANAEVIHNLIIQKMILPASSLGMGSSDELLIMPFGINYQASAGFSLNQMIFDGSYFVGLQAAKTYMQLAEKEQIKTKTDVVEAVTKGYYNVLVNKERYTLLEKNEVRLKSMLDETKLMYQNGFVEKIDVDRLEVQYNNIRVEKRKIERLIELSVQLLKYQMGMPVHQPVSIEGSLDGISFEYSEDIDDNFDYNRRVEYAQILVNRDLRKLDLKNNRVQYLPKITAFAGLGANTGAEHFRDVWNFSDRWFSNSAIGVRFSVPIFDGMYKSYRIQRNRIQLQQLENQMKDLRNVIDLQIDQSHINLKNNYDNLLTQKENMRVAEEVARVARIKYEQGVGSNIEVLNAETSLKEAQTNYYSALYDALISKVDLEKSLGNIHVR